MNLVSITSVISKIIDNRGKSVPTQDTGFPLIATNCIKHSSIYPTFENIRYVSEDILNSWFRASLKPNDILFVNKGTPGRTCLVPDPVNFCAAQDMIAFRIDSNVADYRYVFMVLRSDFIQKKIQNFHVGVVIPHFKKHDLDNLKIPLPDIRKQGLIGNLYLSLSNKIELNNKINQELEKTAKDLYNYWFVQFDFPDGNKRPYKSSGGKMVYNDVLKREIPEGWTVESIANNKLSKILKPGIKQFDGQKIYLPTAAIENDRIIDKSNLITYDNREGRANMEPVDNSVWFAKMKSTKKVLYFGDYSSQRISQTILSTGMLGLKCVENALEYIWNFVNDDSFEAVKNKLSHGATQEGVNNDDLLYFPILIPSIETLRDYSVLVKDLYKQKYFNEIENECLTELRDSLLPMLMNGQVSVS